MTDPRYTEYRIRVLTTAPKTDQALLDEICGCLNGFAADGDPKHLRIAKAHLECLLILSSIQYDDGTVWDGEEPIVL